VGQRISVQVIPNLEGGSYVGMPVYAEVGPIVLDGVVEDKVMEHLQNKVCDLAVNIEEIPFEIEGCPSAFPIEGIINLNKENKTLEVFMVGDEEKKTSLASCSFSDQYPAIEFNRTASTLFELQLSATQTVKLSTETSIDRDVIATAIRMFGNDDLNDSDLPEISETSETQEAGLSVQTNSKTRKRGGSSNLEILMKRERLIKQIKQLEKDNLRLTNALDEEKESRGKLEVEITGLNQKVESSSANTLKLQEEIDKLQKEKEGLAAEKVFLMQEVNLFRSQNQELENILKDFEAQSLKSKESIDKDREKDREFISFEFQETIKGLETKLVNASMEIDQLKKENEQANQRYQSLQNDGEQKVANINALQKKIQSLVQENSKLMRSRSPNGKGSAAGNLFENYGEELTRLKLFNQEISNSFEKIRGNSGENIGAGAAETLLLEDLDKLVIQLNEKLSETQTFFGNIEKAAQ